MKHHGKATTQHQHDVVSEVINGNFGENMHMKNLCLELYREYVKLLDQMHSIKFEYKALSNLTRKELRDLTAKEDFLAGQMNADDLLDEINAEPARKNYTRKVDELLKQWDSYCDKVSKEAVEKCQLYWCNRNVTWSTNGEIIEALLTHGEQLESKTKKSETKKKGKK